MKKAFLIAVFYTGFCALCAPVHADDTKKNTTSTRTLSTESRSSQSLLLPAVQAVRETSHTPQRPASLARTTSSGESADTTCNGVASCNDMIATCIALGGNSTATHYDPETGAPDGATCFAPGPGN